MGSSQYLYNAKMREEIAEQLGVTPTPGGLEILLRQSENNRMAHGGIMNMNKGGSALMNPFERGDAAKVTAAQANPFSPYYTGAPATSLTSKIGTNALIANSQPGSIMKEIFTPELMGNTILSGMTGGLGPFMKWGGKQIWNKFGGMGTRDRILGLMGNKMMSSDSAEERDLIQGMIDNLKDMSTNEFQEAIEGWKVEGQILNNETGEWESAGALPAQDMGAGMSTAQAVMAMPTYGAMYNVGGSGGHGKGAGGNFGQGQRMIRKEQKKIKQRANKYDQFGDESWYLSEGYPPEQANYYANTFKNMYGSGQNLIDTMHDRGFGQGAYEAFDRVAESPPESAADSKGRPQNWSEIFSHYQETGSFDESPEAQWGGG